MSDRSSTSNSGKAKNPDARGQAVLSAIIKEHLISGEPVGSRTISDRFAHKSGWSSATIRNVMADLEDAGHLCLLCELEENVEQDGTLAAA